MALFDEGGDAVDGGVVFVFDGVVFAVDVYAEEFAEAVVEYGTGGAEECFEDIVAALVGFAADEFDEYFSLAFGEAFEGGFVLVEYFVFHFFEVGFPFFFGLESLEVFVGFGEGFGYEFGVGEGFAHVADGAPVVFFLFFVFEPQGREYVDVVEYDHHDGVAVDDGVVHATEHFVSHTFKLLVDVLGVVAGVVLLGQGVGVGSRQETDDKRYGYDCTTKHGVGVVGESGAVGRGYLSWGTGG